LKLNFVKYDQRIGELYLVSAYRNQITQHSVILLTKWIVYDCYK